MYKRQLISTPAHFDQIIDKYRVILNLPKKVTEQLTRLSEKHFAAYGRNMEEVSEHFSTCVNAAHLKIPAMIVHDRGDREVAYSEGECLAATWQGVTFITTEGLGHRRILRDPEVVGQAVAFILQNGTAH